MTPLMATREHRTSENCSESESGSGATTTAAETVLAILRANPRTVFTQQILCVLLEDQFAHQTVRDAISGIAQRILVEKRVLDLSLSDADDIDDVADVARALTLSSTSAPAQFRPTRKPVEILLARAKSFRDATKPVNDAVASFESYLGASAAIGRHLENLTLDAASRTGIRLVGRSVNTYRGRTWSETNENLDFIIEDDDWYWGIEVKNQLRAPDERELERKWRMCRSLGLAFIVVARYMSAFCRARWESRGVGVVLMGAVQLPHELAEMAGKLEAYGLRVERAVESSVEFRQQIAQALFCSYQEADPLYSRLNPPDGGRDARDDSPRLAA